MNEALVETPGVPARRPGIYVRRPDFDPKTDVPRYWCRNEPFATHILDALSSVFPVGEAFFVRSVMHYADRAKDDPKLRAEVRAFAGQEGPRARASRAAASQSDRSDTLAPSESGAYSSYPHPRVPL